MEPDTTAARAEAASWARLLLARSDTVILDTETTDLSSDAEIVQIAIIDLAGTVLLDSLVRPTQPIPARATAIHGITDRAVAAAPTFAELAPRLRELLAGKTVVAYNAGFDERMLEQSARAHQLPIIPQLLGIAEFEDVMEPYSAYVGDWSTWHGNWRWQRLPGGDHSALGDARATLRVIRRMAGVLNAEITVRVMDQELIGYDAHYRAFYVGGWPGERKETPLSEALSAFVADLVVGYSDRTGSPARQRLAHEWLTQWRRDQGWRQPWEKTATDGAPGIPPSCVGPQNESNS